MKNPKERSTPHLSQEIIEALTVPDDFDPLSKKRVPEFDEVIPKKGRKLTELDARVIAHRDAVLPVLEAWSRRERGFNERLWPPHLYIPRGANYRDYWIHQPPADHRYAFERPDPLHAHNIASVQDGTLSTYNFLNPAAVGNSVTTEATLGILYHTSMTYGTIEFQPHILCTGTVNTCLDYDWYEKSGHVEVKAQLVLAAWEQIPTGVDLLASKAFDLQTTGQVDTSDGEKHINFTKSFGGSDLSATFIVEAGHRYILGVISRISILTTLHSAPGKPFPVYGPDQLHVFGLMNCKVPEMDVLTKVVYIP